MSRPKRFRKLTPETIDKVIATIRPIPQVALKIIRTVHSGDYSMRDIAREVRQDQIISAKVINMCNSVYVSPKVRIKSIDQGLVMLGEKLILQLVVSSALEEFFHDSDKGYSLCKGGLYHHAMATAIVAEKLAEYTGKSDEDVAYTAGLLHDIGKVVLDQHIAKASPLFYRRIFQEGEELLGLERELIGFTHIEAGRRLAELWNLPDIISEVIEFHSSPEKAEIDPHLSYLVYIADLLVSRFKVGHDLDCIGTGILEKAFNELGMEIGRLEEVIAMVPWKMIETPGDF